MHEQKQLYLVYSQQTHLFHDCTFDFPVVFIVSEAQIQKVVGVFLLLFFLGKRRTTAQESTQKTIQASWFSSGQ